MRLGKLATMVIWRLEINSENSTSLCNRRSIRNRFTGPVCGHNRHFDFVFFFLFHFSQSTQEQITIIVKIMKTDETIGMDRTVWGGRGGLLYNCAGGPLSHSPSIYQQSQLLFPFTVFEVSLCGHRPAPAWNTLRAHCSSSYVQQSAPEGGNLILAQACFSFGKDAISRE